MPKLEQAVKTTVTVKLAGLKKAVNCNLLAVEENGIWISSRELNEQIRQDSQQVVLPAGYSKVFVPHVRLDFLVYSTENPND